MIILKTQTVHGTPYDLLKAGCEYVVVSPMDGSRKIHATLRAASNEVAIEEFRKWTEYRYREFSPPRV